MHPPDGTFFSKDDCTHDAHKKKDLHEQVPRKKACGSVPDIQKSKWVQTFGKKSKRREVSKVEVQYGMDLYAKEVQQKVNMVSCMPILGSYDI